MFYIFVSIGLNGTLLAHLIYDSLILLCNFTLIDYTILIVISIDACYQELM